MPIPCDSPPRPPTRSRGRIWPGFPSCRRPGRSATAPSCHRSWATPAGTMSRRTPTAPARSCSRSSSRASARCWSATPTGGASRSTRTTSIGSCRRGSTTRPEAPSCSSRARSTCSSPRRADQLERIAATPGLKVQKAESTQTLYVGFDQASPELRSSNVKGRNPFADRRVRQAFYQGIDIGRIVEALHGLAVPAGMLIWPKGNGWSEELDRRPPYDPDESQSASGRGRLP